MPIMRRRLGDGAVHAERVEDAGEDEGDAGRPQYPPVAAGQFEQAEQDQDDRHVLGIIAVGADPPEQRLVAAVADADLELPPQPAHPPASQMCRMAAAPAMVSVIGRIMANFPSLGPDARTRRPCLQLQGNSL